MIKTILFDIYGMIISREMRFSQRFSEEFKVPTEKLSPFFQNEFQLCLVGKADLKTEIKKYLADWGWKKSADELLQYWFGHEGGIDKRMTDSIKSLRKEGIKCFASTQNEKYLTDYTFKEFGLAKYFNGVFSTNEIGYLKSQQEFWQSVYEKLGNPDKKTVLVWDDNEKNIKAAKNSGFSAELYTGFDDYKNKINKYINKK